MTDALPSGPKGDIELQKLAFEREKLAIEEQWKKKTFSWSILSTLIGSAITVVIALITVGGRKPAQPLPSSLTAAAVEDCRLSIQRLPTLARQENQSVSDLRIAINRHVTDCDQVLVEMSTYLARSGR